MLGSPGPPVTGETARPPVFRRRASNVLILGFALQVIALAFVMMAIAATLPPQAAVLVAIMATVATGATFLVLALLLDRGRSDGRRRRGGAAGAGRARLRPPAIRDRAGGLLRGR